MNSSVSGYKYITGAATTTFAATETARVLLHGIQVNKILTGTLTIKAGSTTIGVLAASTPIGVYWLSTMGIEIEALTIVNSSAEDVTVFYNNI